MRNTALLGLLFFSWSIVCLTEGLKIKEVLRRRRQACDDGTYEHEGLVCCLCPIGYFVVQHCTTPRTSGICERCEDGYYRDQPNGQMNCEICAACDERSNKKVKDKCSSYSNTVCSCLDDYYCQGDCKVCHACDKCEDSSVKVACTATNNTECNEKIDGPNAGAIVPIIVLIVLIAAAAVYAFYLWRNKKFCFSKPATNPTEGEILLDDVNLAPVLSDIAQTLGWKVVRDVTRSEVTDVDIENAQGDHPHDTEEQAVQLLSTWYQKHGLTGAYSTLITKLRQKGLRGKASEVQRIVEQLRNTEK